MVTMITRRPFASALLRAGLRARLVGGALAIVLLAAMTAPVTAAQGLDSSMLEAAQEAASTPVNALCPVTTDEPIEDDLFLDIDGERIGFCCKKCKRKYEADPDFYAEGLAEVRLVAKATGAGMQMDHGNMDHDEGGEHMAAGAVDADHDEGGGHEEGVEHDHATGHGDSEAGLFSRLVVLVGKTHPLAVHLPIGLGLFAALSEALFMLKKDRVWRTTATLAMIFAALGALAAAPLGWIAAGDADFPASLASTLQLHRYAGLAAVAWLLLGAWASREAREGEGKLFRVLALGAPVLIGLAGHLGGTLVFGTGYFSL
jgi:uncharacterized membrane protein